MQCMEGRFGGFVYSKAAAGYSGQSIVRNVGPRAVNNVV